MGARQELFYGHLLDGASMYSKLASASDRRLKRLLLIVAFVVFVEVLGVSFFMFRGAKLAIARYWDQVEMVRQQFKQAEDELRQKGDWDDQEPKGRLG